MIKFGLNQIVLENKENKIQKFGGEAMNESIKEKAKNKKAVICPKCRGIMKLSESSPMEKRDADAQYQCGSCGYSNALGALWIYSH